MQDLGDHWGGWRRALGLVRTQVVSEPLRRARSLREGWGRRDRAGPGREGVCLLSRGHQVAPARLAQRAQGRPSPCRCRRRQNRTSQVGLGVCTPADPWTDGRWRAHCPHASARQQTGGGLLTRAAEGPGVRATRLVLPQAAGRRGHPARGQDERSGDGPALPGVSPPQ